MKVKIRNIVAFIIATVFMLNICTAFVVYAESDVVIISTANEFVQFRKKCVLDEYSMNLTVKLKNDIDLTGVQFSPIPIFCGTFDGQNHKIIGVAYNHAGSIQGVFRCVSKGAAVLNLNVEAVIEPTGSKNTVGGIVGKNYGLVQNCTFSGSVKGDSNIGGIVGINELGGEIRLCSSSGSVEGNRFVGGIVGKNIGMVVSANNGATVNTKYEERKASMEDLSIYTTLNNFDVKSNEDSSQSTMSLKMDVGGIAGFSSGVLQGCENHGEVGYSHVGYNIGGIVGRQSGYVTNCTNRAPVWGRKDVGGIAGQAEPYIFLNSQADAFNRIDDELGNLKGIVDSALDDADNATDRFKTSLENIGDYADSARTTVGDLADKTVDFADENLEEVNEFSNTVSSYLDRFEPLIDDLSDASDSLSNALDDVQSAVDTIDLEFPELDDTMDKISMAIEDVSSATGSGNDGIKNLQKAVDHLKDAVDVKDTKKQKQALKDISSAMESIAEARNKRADALKTLQDSLKNLPTGFGELSAAIGDIANAEYSIASNIVTMAKNIVTVATNTELDMDSLKKAADYLDSASTDLRACLNILGRSMTALSQSVSELSDSLSDFIDDTDKQLDKALDDISAALDDAKYATDNLTSAVDGIGDIMGDLADEEPLEFTLLGDEYRALGDSLSDTLALIGDELGVIRDIAAEEEGIFTSNVRSMSSSASDIFDLILEEIRSISDEKSLDDYLKDTSDELAKIKEGKVENCKNYESVDGDFNIGGIIGAMSIDVESDPEDDIERPTTFNFIFETKAVVQNCINYGSTAVKKGCSGGIVGKMSIGTAFSCENYANISSETADYVGGIAGQSLSSIISCYSKADYEGKSYIGGICGYASKITNSYAIAKVTGDEYIGAIAGFAEDDAKNILSCFYVDNDCGAIDSTSYKSKGEPIDYITLANISSIPKEFISFKVTFVADDKIIATESVAYNEPLRYVKKPQIPEKEGYYGKWADYPTDYMTGNLTVEAEYNEWLTIIDSMQRTPDAKLAIAFAEGEFTEESRLNVTDCEVEIPKNATEAYHIALSNVNASSSDIVTIRLLNIDKNKAKAYQYSDGAWQEMKVVPNGQYIKFDMQGSEGDVYVVYKKGGFNPLWLLFLIPVLAAAAFIFIKRPKTKRHK